MARDPRATRRVLLETAAAAVLAGTAGCLGDQEVPDPVALEDGQACDRCGMVIDQQPGPAGQAFYPDDAPLDLPDDREDGHARFCSALDAYVWTLDRDPQPAVTYLTDYSTVDYEVWAEGGEAFVSAHLGADAFADATELTMIADGDVQGAMGPAMVPFSDPEDATAFQETHGGDRLAHDEVSRELVQSMMG